MAYNRGDYTFNTLTLYKDDDESYGIINMFQSIQIEESLFDNSIRGSLKVVDREDTIVNIVPDETLRLDVSFSTEGDQYDYSFLVTDVIIDEVSADSKSITLTLADDFTIDLKRHIAVSKNGTIDSIMTDLVPEVIADATLWKQKFVFNSWSLGDCIDFLEKKAVSTLGNAGFKFFRTSHGVYFRSLVDMYNQKAERTIIPLAHSSGTVADISEDVYTDIAITELMEFDDDISNGGHGSSLYIFDPFKKSYQVVESTNPYNSISDMHEDIRIFKYQHKDKHTSFESHIADYFQNNLNIDTSVERKSVNVSIPGTISNQIGKVVNLVVLGDNRNQDGAKVISDEMSDKYLITTCHTALGAKFNQNITLQRFTEFK